MTLPKPEAHVVANLDNLAGVGAAVGERAALRRLTEGGELNRGLGDGLLEGDIRVAPHERGCEFEDGADTDGIGSDIEGDECSRSDLHDGSHGFSPQMRWGCGLVLPGCSRAGHSPPNGVQA